MYSITKSPLLIDSAATAPHPQSWVWERFLTIYRTVRWRNVSDRK